MVKLYIVIFLLVSVSCRPSDQGGAPPAELQELSVDEMVMAMDAFETYLLEVAGPSEIIVRDSQMAHKCRATEEVIQSWSAIRVATSQGELVVRDKLAFDPNRELLQANVAYITRLGDGRFEIRYVEDEKWMIYVADALGSIFGECHIDLRLRIVVEYNYAGRH